MLRKLDYIKSHLYYKGYIIKDFSIISEGANSSSFKLKSEDSNFALKFYPKTSANDRDRLKSEINFLNLLKYHKYPNTPKPLEWDFKEKWLLLSWMNGVKIDNPKINHCNLLINFLRDIQIFKTSEIAKEIGNASEACFTIESHINHIKERIKRLGSYIYYSEKTNNFYSEEVVKIMNNCNTRLQELIDNQCSRYRNHYRSDTILSPSDVGFHNVLLEGDKMNFIDFEYAGWDDPMKLISDLILQPDYNIPLDSINCLNGLIKDKSFPEISRDNMPLMIELYRIKWITIILNPIFKVENIGNFELMKLTVKKVDFYWEESKKRISNALAFLKE